MFDAKELLNQLLGANKGGATKLGDIGGVLGSVLNQAITGVKEGASELEKRTGVGAKAESALKDATGKSADDYVNQAKEVMSQNQMATGAVAAGLGALLLGSKTGRGIAGHAAAMGGLALIGGLAYKAYRNHQQGKALLSTGGEPEVAPPPAESPFGETGDRIRDQATALLVIRSMIAAAASDGLIDNEERSRIVGRLEAAGMDVHSAQFLDAEFAKPASLDDIVAAAATEELRIQAYTAAYLSIDLDTPAERAFLEAFAARLGLPPNEVAHIHATVGEIKLDS